MTDYGYARVSVGSADNNTLANQRLVLRDVYGIPDENVYTDIASGGDFQRRQGLAVLLDAVGEGDAVHVTALDRLGRSLVEVVNIIEDLNKRGVTITSQREHLDFSTPMGKMLMQISCGFAEMERGLIRERTKAGLARAGANGKHLGRRRVVTKEKAQLAQSMRAEGTRWRRFSLPSARPVPHSALY